jgi:hypothetical protein
VVAQPPGRQTNAREPRAPLAPFLAQQRSGLFPRVLLFVNPRTPFRSAFLVRSPVPPERIADVRIIEDSFELPEAEIELKDVLRSLSG